MSIHQRQDEPLREFVTRLNNETLQVKHFDHTVAIAAFTNSFRDKDFTKSLTKKPPKVFVNLLLRAKKYINAKEAMVIKYQGHDKLAKEENKERYHQRKRISCRDHNYQQRNNFEVIKEGDSPYYGKGELGSSSPTNEKGRTPKR